MYNYIGNVFVIVTGIYSGNGDLDWFINAGRLYNIGRFYNTGISGCDGGKGGYIY